VLYLIELLYLHGHNELLIRIKRRIFIKTVHISFQWSLGIIKGVTFQLNRNYYAQW